LGGKYGKGFLLLLRRGARKDRDAKKIVGGPFAEKKKGAAMDRGIKREG